MTRPSLFSLIRQNIARSKKNFAMSSVGIVVGVATFVFFIGLVEGIKEVLLGKVFLVDQIEVVPKKFDTGLVQTDSFLGFGGSKPMDDALVEQFRQIEGVVGVFPKMKFTFPTRGHGGKNFLGRDVYAELIADGLDPSLVADDLDNPEVFRDLEVEISCAGDDACPAGRTCADGQCVKRACKPKGDNGQGDCPTESYCANDTRRCETYIPVVVSNHLLALYNSNLVAALSGAGRTAPRLSKNALIGVTLNATFGKSFLGESKRADSITRRIRLVGFSDKAISVGVTLPIAYVKRLNTRYSGASAGSTYHSIILQAADQAAVVGVSQRIEEMGFTLTDASASAKQAGLLITVLMLVFSLISAIIVGIAAVNISHTFFMIIYQRKREIGLFRAIGATRGHIRGLILGEAAFIGFTAGLLGTGIGVAVTQLADLLGARLPDFPYKPDSFFAFPAWLWPLAIGFATAFCLVGAFFPASAAARLEPAEALTD